MDFISVSKRGNLILDHRTYSKLLAGDTAQAISQESTFRFADTKALFYDHFASVATATGQAQLAQPTMFGLSKNYRSHQGILALASAVMGWLWKGMQLYDGYWRYHRH